LIVKRFTVSSLETRYYLVNVLARAKDYVRKPFPEIVKWNDVRKVNECIRTLVIEKVVKY